MTTRKESSTPSPQPHYQSPSEKRVPPETLARRLGLLDAVVIGLGSMLGAGVFAAFTPAAQAAGSWLLIGLLLAAALAFCNATSSARLAALYPQSGGTYVYGRERLGSFWGYLAGWGFVIGKTASCAAIALTIGNYVAPAYARPVAVASVVALTSLNYFGVRGSSLVTRAIVAVVLAVLAGTVLVSLLGGEASISNVVPEARQGFWGVLQAAGFLFFAFAGYARIATLGEEVREPQRTIPRAIPLALLITLVVYALIAVAVLAVLGPAGVAATAAPLSAAVEAGSWSWFDPAVRVGAAIACLGSLLALLLGVSRTSLAMARDRHLPHFLAAVHPEYGVPHHAELATGVVVAIVVLTVDVRGAIGFSSFAVLIYYAIANASALTLSRHHGTRVIPVLGIAGCIVVAISLPVMSTLIGAGALLLGALVWVLRRRHATG